MINHTEKGKSLVLGECEGPEVLIQVSQHRIQQSILAVLGANICMGSAAESKGHVHSCVFSGPSGPPT